MLKSVQQPKLSGQEILYVVAGIFKRDNQITFAISIDWYNLKVNITKNAILTLGPDALVPISFILVDHFTAVIAGVIAAGIWIWQTIEYLMKRNRERETKFSGWVVFRTYNG